MPDEKSQPTAMPPYIAFASLKTFIAGLKEHGVPSRIDRSIMTNFSGAVAGQVLTSLRFLHLVNGENQPTPMLGELVTAFNGEGWKDAVAKMMRQAYRPMFQIDLATATPSLFSEHFKEHYSGADAVLRKSMTFFHNAVRETNIQVSSRLLSGTKPRSAPTKRRTGKTSQKNGTENGKPNDNPPPPPQHPASTTSANKAASQVVFEVFDPINMTPEVQQATLALLTYLKSIGK